MAWSLTATTTGTVNAPPNQIPTIGSLSVNPDPVTQGNNLTLTANSVGDNDGTVVKVEFYRDTNGNGVIDVGTDTLLGTDTSSSGGWTCTVSTSGFPVGSNAYLARAQDNSLAWSLTATATGTVNAATMPDLVISSGTPTVTPATVVAGGSVVLSAWTVNNQGTGASGDFFNGFYLSADSVITSSDTYLNGNDNASLAAGSQFSWGAPTLTIPAATSPGNYYIGILVDCTGQVSESNEANNYVSCPITITGLTPVNDNFSGRTAVSANGGTMTGTNVGATKEPGEPNPVNNSGGKSVWWTWTPTASGSAQIDTIGSNFDTILGVYTGSSVSSLTQVAADDDSGGNLTSKVTFTAVAGTTYQIAVDGFNGASGNITLDVIAPVPLVVTTNPASATTDVGLATAVTFTAAASGTPTPTVKWQVSSGSGFTDLSNGGVYSGVTSPTLTVTGATVAMNGYQYRAVFTNGAAPDATTTAATLTVNAALGIVPTTLPAGVVNTLYHQTITVSGGTTPYTTFTVSGFNAGGTGLTSSEITVNASAGTIVVNGTPTAAGSASFTVNVIDTVGATLSQSYAITVQPEATTTTVTDSPNPSVVGQPVTFTAIVSGVAPVPGSPPAP